MYRKLLPWHVNPHELSVCVKETAQNRFEHKTLTLLNWNVHKNNHHLQWLHDFAHILHRYAPNLIAFQEYQTRSEKSILDQHDTYGYSFFPNIQMKNHRFGLLNAATCEHINCNFLLSLHVEPLFKTPKISLSTQYKLHTDETLTLINTHMINFVNPRKYLSQIDQIEALCQGSEKIILTGDFNTWSKKRMHLLEHMTKTLGLEHLAFTDNRHQKSYLPHPLDHVFYKGVKPIEATILHQIKSSDHKPLVAKFSLSL